ncbi:MAG: ribosome assembly cofactor RimP [Tannerellaceae bacterium]|jgi:ribosome maturation factor RimP|nr:ribosome assembly cofactor RimP [Tannerellaceae bacterium]
MIDKEKICRLMSEKLLASADYLVDVQVKPGNLVVVEVDNDRGVSIETCAELNRYIRDNIPAEEGDYELEVGSPGLSAPFKILRQYAKYTGREVECLLKTGEKLQGILKSADESGIRLSVETQVKPPEGAKRKQTIAEEKAYGYDEIKHTKYVISFK